MSEEFPIIEVPPDASESVEQMGTKPKFWLEHPDLGLCLYKASRQTAGEDWAEKIASELCHLLGLPHARYELASYQGQRGTVSPSFVPPDAGLVHGNEILLKVVPDYPESKEGAKNFYRVSRHTLEIVLPIIGVSEIIKLPVEWTPPEGIATACDTFVGYLLLDAWIGNTDRHHENWGLIIKRGTSPGMVNSLHLAPTYDHASSMGRNELDQNRRKRLNSKDAGFTVMAYAERGTSAFYPHPGARKPLTTFDAFRRAAIGQQRAALAWVNRLEGISPVETLALFRRIPRGRISEDAVEFAQKMLEFNRSRLLALREAESW